MAIFTAGSSSSAAAPANNAWFSGDFTWGGWVYLPSAPTSPSRVLFEVAEDLGSGTKDKIVRAYNSTVLEGMVFDGGTITTPSSAAIGTGGWHHALLTLDTTADEVVLWVDGVATAATTATGSYTGYTTPDLIIGRDGTDYVSMEAEHMAFWTRELTSGEIAAQYAGQAPSALSSGLVSYADLRANGTASVGSNYTLSNVTFGANHAPVSAATTSYPPVQSFRAASGLYRR